MAHLQVKPAPNQKSVAATAYVKPSKKVGMVEDRSKRPAPGERKALRKRIVLSNTNALEIRDMRDFSIEILQEEGLQGQVLGIPGPLVDQLRAVEAFKTTQAWRLYRRPGVLVREETLDYGKLMEELSQSGRMVRRILYAQELVIGHTAYAPLSSSSTNTLYAQKDYTANLLKSINLANPHLATLTLATPPSSSGLPIPIPPNISLSRLASLGIQDPDIAWRVFTLLMTELTMPNSQLTAEQARPPLLLTMDSLAHAMRPDTAYRHPNFEPMHAHDLAIVDFFMGHFSGRKQLPNGGLVLGITSGSNQPRNPTLDLTLAQLEHESSSSRSSSAQPQLNTLVHLTQPMTLQQWELQGDPFKTYDQRVVSIFKNNYEGRVELHKVKGLNKDEARGLMEYWAKSGLLRGKVSDNLVSEKWILSGQGVVGELEKAVVRMRV
ncbi:MAG: hypothetical protein Q9191_002388 [Dirinaria sp. TL-2023a]